MTQQMRIRLGEQEPAVPGRSAAVLNRLASLLDGYRSLSGSHPLIRSPRASQPQSLLENFRELRIRSAASAVVQSAKEYESHRRLLGGYRDAAQKDRLHQVSRADDFNMLEIMGLVGNEIRHSMVLAWLLDHELRKLGTHAQANLGFRLFLKQFKLPLRYAGYRYWVRREVGGADSIIDIEIACRGEFLIHIENKIWASEGVDQTDREWNDVKLRAAELGLDARDGHVHALFLTPKGKIPANPNFTPISWAGIVSVFQEFAEQAKPAEVKLFASHYAEALRRFIVIPDI